MLITSVEQTHNQKGDHHWLWGLSMQIHCHLSPSLHKNVLPVQLLGPFVYSGCYSNSVNESSTQTFCVCSISMQKPNQVLCQWLKVLASWYTWDHTKKKNLPKGEYYIPVNYTLACVPLPDLLWYFHSFTTSILHQVSLIWFAECDTSPSHVKKYACNKAMCKIAS